MIQCSPELLHLKIFQNFSFDLFDILLKLWAFLKVVVNHLVECLIFCGGSGVFYLICAFVRFEGSLG